MFGFCARACAILLPMNFQTTLYIDAETPVHALDARVKALLLLAYSVAIFFADSWVGMAVFTVVALCAGALACLPWRRVLLLLVPVFVLAAFALVFNVVNAADFAAGLASGVLVALRMVDLCVASFVVCFTTTSTQLVEAFSLLIGPLRVIRLPVDDIAFALSLALRFIPLVFEQLDRVRVAQASRGAMLDCGPVFARLRAWGAVFIPLFVGLFRRADSVAVAMDSRCYGAGAATGARRTSLSRARMQARDVAALLVALTVFALAAVLA